MRSAARCGRRALAASFVMTFAAACDSKGTAPAAAPTVDVGTSPASSASPAPAQAAPPAELATASATTAPTLAPAPTFGQVVRREDGTCMWYSGAHCPRAANGRIIPCNPPPPHRVKCPDDAGP